MGEVALRRSAAGIETTRGVAVPATKKLYGTNTMTRNQPRRYAVEDRGMWTDKFRSNPKLIDAGFTHSADATFEDVPFYSSLFLRGGIASSGSAAAGYTWAVPPDVNTDSLNTMTMELGDDTVAWRGAFGTVDTADFTLALDDALRVNLGGFVQDWIPQNYGVYPTGFTGFTPGLPERAVESVMGWQARLYIDAVGVPPGTTVVAGRFIGATWSIHNQDKRKYFGDAIPIFQKLGRGRRQISCQLTFEAVDTAQYGLFANGTPAVVRIQLGGLAITGTTLGATSAAINPGIITTIAVTALAANLAGGTVLNIGGINFTVAAAGALAGATSIPVVSQNYGGNAIASGATLMVAKSQSHDFWGFWESFAIGARDTNTTFQMTLQDVYDNTAAKEYSLTVVNGNSAL